MAKEMHIGRIGTRLQKVFAGLDDKVEQAVDMLAASANMIKGVENGIKGRNPSAGGKLNDLHLNLRGVIEGLNETLSLYEKEFYEEDTESAIQESLVATAKVSKDTISYMAGCVLSEACYALLQELKPEKADKATADNIGKFLTTEGIDFAHYTRMLQQEMKRIADETDMAWQGRCSIDELNNEFPDANVPMRVALLSRGHESRLEEDPAIAKYMKERGVTSGSVPPCDDDAVLDACHAVFEDMNEGDMAEADKDSYGYEEIGMTEEAVRKLVKHAHDAGFQLRMTEGTEDDMSPNAFLVKLKSFPDGQNPMMDIHADNEGVITFQQRSGDNYDVIYDPEIKEAKQLFVDLGMADGAEEKEPEEEAEEQKEE